MQTLKAVGTKPLLLHNVQSANPLTRGYQAMAELRGTPARRRTEKWHEEMAHTMFLAGFYDAPEIDGPAFPCENVRQCLVGAARASRLGRQMERALSVVQAAVPIIYEGPKDPEQMWQAGTFHLTKMIRGTGGASPSTWPQIFPWALIVPFELDEETLNIRDFEEVARRAGRIEGVGASRKQGYGRFDALIQHA